MKHLQNNFTTPEQSKRLLELGVPADSADCFIRLGFNITESPDIITYYSTFSEIKEREAIKPENFIPCWSVGRLIEIYCICIDMKYIQLAMIDDMMESLVYMIEHDADIDFSKLNK